MSVWGELWQGAKGVLGYLANPYAWLAVQAYDLFKSALPEFPIPEQGSATYSWDTPQNLPANDRPVPVVFGCCEVGGLTLYQGGDDRDRVVFVAVGEGPVALLRGAKLNDVPLSELGTAAAYYYTGTGSQVVDPLFTSWRHSEAKNLEAWNAKTGNTDPAVTTFEVLEDGAFVFVKLGCLHATSEEANKRLYFTLEFRATGAGSWTAGGSYEVVFSPLAGGLDEAKLALREAGTTTTTNVALPHAYDDTDRIVYLNTRYEQPGYRTVHTVKARAFAAGTYDLRVSYGSEYHNRGRLIDGQLLLGSVELLETSGAQAYRHTAYVAAVVPADDVVNGSARVVTPVAGLADVEVWDADTETWEARFSNNPVWCARHLWKNSRWGAGQASFGDDRAKLAAAYCDEPIATLDTGATSSWGGEGPADTTCVVAVADPSVDYSGYLAVGDNGDTRLILAWDKTASSAQVDRAWSSTPTTITIKEQRFRFDYSFEEQADAEEQVRRIAAHCRGLVWREGDCLYFDVERARNRSAFQSGVDCLTPDLIVAGTFRAERRSEAEVPSGLVVKFLDPDQSTKKQSEVFGDQGGSTETLELYGCRNPGQARRVAAYVYNAARRPWVVTLRASLATLALEPGDRVGVAHPVTGWGYDMTDPDEPVRDAPSEKDFVVVRVADGPDDLRDYTLREYDAALYSDTADRRTVTKPESTFTNPFAVPAALASLYGSNLGDLTNDGIWNPVLELGWVHPNPSGISRVDLYYNLGGADWVRLGTARVDEPFRATLPGLQGTVTFKGVPVSQAQIQGVWADQPTCTLTVQGGLPYVERTVADATYHVATTGSDTTGDGTSGTPWATVTHALSRIPRRIDHQVVIALHAGTYTESIAVEERAGYGSLTITRNGTDAVTILAPSDSLVQLPGCFLLRRVQCRLSIAHLELLTDADYGNHLIEAYHCDRLDLSYLAGGYDGTFTLGLQCFLYAEDSTITVTSLTDAAGHDPLEYGYNVRRCRLQNYHEVGRVPLQDVNESIVTTTPGPDLARGLSASLFAFDEDCAVAEPRLVTPVPWDLTLTSVTVTIPAAGSAGTTGTMDVDLLVGGVSILDAPLSIASGGTTDTTTSFSGTGTLDAGDELEMHVTSVHTTPAKGLLLDLRAVQKNVL